MLSCEWDLATFYQWLTVIVSLFCLTAAQIAVMITNGRSDDQVDAAAGAVADNGISLFAVGECGAGAVVEPLKLYLFIYLFFIRALPGLSAPYAVRNSCAKHLDSWHWAWLICEHVWEIVVCVFFPPVSVRAIAQISERANVAAICVRGQFLILSFAWARHFFFFFFTPTPHEYSLLFTHKFTYTYLTLPLSSTQKTCSSPLGAVQ